MEYYNTINSNYSSEEQFKTNGKIYEYMSASNPILPEIPVLVHNKALYNNGPSRIIPFDLSKQLNIPYEATSPNLLASFIKINKNDSYKYKSQSTSNAFYIIHGKGSFLLKNSGCINYEEGDMVVIPTDVDFKNYFLSISAQESDTVIYCISDEPLLKYLHVSPLEDNFKPALFKKKDMMNKIEEISHEVGYEHKNRLGILLGNKKTSSKEEGGTGTLTLTPTLWSLLNVLPANSYQKPHRHNSVALDLCISGGNDKVYTLMGPELDEKKQVKNPIKCVWENGSVFVTPPGWWHSHHNDGDNNAYVLPVQDAGLYTHQRTLNIEFS